MSMKKWLLLLLGLLLIAILTYFCFTSKQKGIRENLVANTKTALGEQASGISVGINGTDFKTTRVVTLQGVVESEAAKAKNEELAKGVEGVAGVDNQLVVAKAKIAEEPKTEVQKPKVVAAPMPSPYTITATKDKDSAIVLNGYVPNMDVHKKLVADAKTLFGDNKVTDNLKESKGAPAAWLETSELGLNKLKDVDYGEFAISDSDFNFKGYIGSSKAKKGLLSEFDSKLNSAYKGSYEIDAPAPKVVAEVVESSQVEKTVESNQTLNVQDEVLNCKTQIDELLSNEKIHFEYDKATIKQDSYKLLVDLVGIINRCPKSKVTIEGHTDSDGSAKYNKKLSQKRADAVKVYLENRGVAKERLTAIGYGEEKPVASNATKEGKEKNRRIEFKFKGVK